MRIEFTYLRFEFLNFLLIDFCTITHADGDAGDALATSHDSLLHALMISRYHLGGSLGRRRRRAADMQHDTGV